MRGIGPDDEIRRPSGRCTGPFLMEDAVGVPGIERPGTPITQRDEPAVTPSMKYR